MDFFFQPSNCLACWLCFISPSSRSIKHLKQKFQPIRKEFWRQLTWQKVSNQYNIGQVTCRTKQIKKDVTVILSRNDISNVILCCIWGDTYIIKGPRKDFVVYFDS